MPRLRSCLDDWPAVTSTLTFARLCCRLEDAVLRLMPEDPRAAGFRFRGFVGVWDSQRQQRAAVTSVTANLHSSFVEETLPHQVKLSMTRIMPLRPGLRSASQSIVEEGVTRLAPVLEMRGAGWSDLHQAHHSVENCSKVFPRRG